LIYDEQYEVLATSAASEPGSNTITSGLPWQTCRGSIINIVRSSRADIESQPVKQVSENDVAYIHHTSGTSSGLPKPVPQTHRAGVCVLPRLEGRGSATFTTTPLYHGGIADCFRAWTSQALIWLFPGADLPITTKNIISSLSIATRAQSVHSGTPPVRYFSSVPYVLQMLAEDADGLERLRGMDIVGVGGAALPQNVGDDLVRRGVNLVSRFGSAECGFLLSSHRQYAIDKEWQYLRVPRHSRFLRFEPQADGSGLSELVVIHGWPHMAKRNRDDGSFATSDLFEPHPEIEDAWRYHSRSDSQITLLTGKKFDPAPLEDAIASASPLVKEVLIFGTGRQVPGALIFCSGSGAKQNSTIQQEEIWTIIEQINSKGQSHTRLSKDMVVFMGHKSATLEKSSKGTLLRGAAEKNFAREIDDIYATNESAVDVSKGISDIQDIKSAVRNIVDEVMGGENTLDDEDDFYHNGCDSAKCSRIRFFLQKVGHSIHPDDDHIVCSRLIRY
jgi:hypothetical protein